MKVLLISPPKGFSPLPPLGLLYISAVLEENDIQTKVIDCPIENMGFDQIPSIIKKENPDIVGVASCTPTITFALKVLRMTKKVDKSIKTIIGGPHASAMPMDTIKNKEADFLVKGEGEVTTLELVKAIEKNKKVDKIDGLWWRKGKKIVKNKERGPIKDLDSLPWPARHHVPVEKYPSVLIPLRLPETQVMATRGCPFRCAFCAKEVFGSTVRARDPKKIVDEIEYLVNEYGIRGLFFYDDTLNLKPKWTMKLCNEIIKREFNDVGFKGQVRVNTPLINRELLKKMKQAGFYMLAYGIESGDPKVLDVIHKNITLDEVRRAVRLTNEAGIRALGFFMIGNIGENKDTIRKTINFAKSLPLDYAQFSIGVPYPATEFYNVVKEKGWLKAKGWEDFIPDKREALVKMPELEQEMLEHMFMKANKEFYFRPSYVLKQIKTSMRSMDDFKLAFKGLNWVVKASRCE